MERTKEQQEAYERFQINIEGLKVGLFELSEKFKRAFEVTSHSQYDGEDTYIGEIKYLKCGQNEHLSQSLREMFEEFFGEIGI
jgi:hypothetical protein